MLEAPRGYRMRNSVGGFGLYFKSVGFSTVTSTFLKTLLKLPVESIPHSFPISCFHSFLKKLFYVYVLGLVIRSPGLKLQCERHSSAESLSWALWRTACAPLPSSPAFISCFLCCPIQRPLLGIDTGRQRGHHSHRTHRQHGQTDNRHISDTHSSTVTVYGRYRERKKFKFGLPPGKVF